MYILFKKNWESIIEEKDFPEDLKHHFQEYFERAYDKEVRYPMKLITKDTAELLYSWAKIHKDRSVMSQLSAYLSIFDNKKAKMTNLRVFAGALQKYFNKDAINHWMFVDNEGVYFPYFIKSITYQDPDSSRDMPAQVTLKAAACSPIESTYSVYYQLEDIRGKTLDEILLKNHIQHETPELIEEYTMTDKKFLQFQNQLYAQFICEGTLIPPKSWRCDYFSVGPIKVLNDMLADKGRSFTPQVTSSFWSEDGQEEVYPFPEHPFIHIYSLTHYSYFYVHVNSLHEYTYDDTLRDKLVLPKEHRTLLDILTQHMAVLKGDMIEGKGNGVTILCKGRPGVGKSLTCEVYSEITHRPLLIVNSGQLGTHPADIEKNLLDFLKKAQRWGVVMLIDEADVFIRKRGNDMHHNAVVSAFLRSMEYFDGLLFLTTNRENDIDDAIESRCIATINYSVPSKSDAAKIWQVLAKEFGTEIPDNLLDGLVASFPDVTGRDIRELLKLTLRYVKSFNKDLYLEAFIDCAQFRAVKVDIEEAVKHANPADSFRPPIGRN